MHKSKANARWNELSSAYQETLDKWLFEEKLSYTQILPRAKKELGFKGQMSSLKRYYARRHKERTVAEFTELRDELATLTDSPTDANALRAASMKLLGRFLYQRMQQSPENVKDWAPVANLMLQNDYNEVLRSAKAEEHQLRREAMAFAREKFQFDTMERALKALPELKELAEAKKDPLTKEYEENAYWNKVRWAMFGVRDVHPESAEEEAEMLAAKKEREARRAREAELANRERITESQPPTPSSRYYKEYMEHEAKREEEQRNRERKYAENRQKAAEAQTQTPAETGEAKPAEPTRKYTIQYAEFLDKLKLWEEHREVLGWEEEPRPEWKGKWPMFEDEA